MTMMFGAVALSLTGCSAASSSSQSTGQNSAANHTATADSSATTNTTGGTTNTTGAASANVTAATTSTNTTAPSSANATGGADTNSASLNGDVQSVIAGIHATGAHMLPTINASISGQPYGKGLRVVKFTSANVGFLAGQGVIMKTTDGGDLFQTAYRANIDFTGLAVPLGSKQDVFAWGHHAIVRSTDSGTKWGSIHVPPTSAAVQQVDFASAAEGFAITGNSGGGTLWKTTDGGGQWSRVSTPPGGVQSVAFGNVSTGWVGLTNGDIIRTTDGGAHWRTVFHPHEQYPGRPEVQAVSDHAAWALIIGAAGMSQTSYSVFRTLGGVTWGPVLGVSTAGAGPAPDGATKAPRGPGSSPGPMVALSASQAVVTGTCEACGMGSGQVSSTNDSGAAWTTYPTIQNGMSMPTSVSFVSLKDGWVLDNTVSDGAFLLRTTDGGQTWHEVYPMVHPHPVEGVSFLNANTGYGLGVPGNANAVLKSTDGGHTWSQVGNLPAKSASLIMTMGNSPIDFVSASRGYAVGPDGTVYATTDGGQTWALAIPASSQSPYDSVTFMPGGQYGIATSYGQNTEVTVNGGQTWNAVQFPSNLDNPAKVQLYVAGLAKLATAPTIKTLINAETARWFSVANDKVAVVPGQNEEGFFITSDGGAHWRNANFGQYLNATTIDFANSQDGWLITLWGSLLRTTDGGHTWTHATH